MVKGRVDLELPGENVEGEVAGGAKIGRGRAKAKEKVAGGAKSCGGRRRGDFQLLIILCLVFFRCLQKKRKYYSLKLRHLVE